MLVTGGSRGIGAATARMAAGAGYDVCVGYASDSAAADEVVDGCRYQGASAVSARADVADEEQVVALFDEAVSELGPVSCLVNNAGILHPVARLDTFTARRLREVFDVNVVGAFMCAREAVRRMSTAAGGDGGSIVNVSSAASYLGSPGEFIDYAASKGAIDTMTIGLAKEVALEGIRVNAVRPGLIETGIHASAGAPDRVERLSGGVPMQRGGTPDEVASVVLYLASDAASYITGALVDVTGGR